MKKHAPIAPVTDHRVAVLRALARPGAELTVPEISRAVDRCRTHQETVAAVVTLLDAGRIVAGSVVGSGWTVPSFRLAPARHASPAPVREVP